MIKEVLPQKDHKPPLTLSAVEKCLVPVPWWNVCSKFIVITVMLWCNFCTIVVTVQNSLACFAHFRDNQRVSEFHSHLEQTGVLCVAAIEI